jgi:hypothetical protein
MDGKVAPHATTFLSFFLKYLIFIKNKNKNKTRIIKIKKKKKKKPLRMTEPCGGGLPTSNDKMGGG